MNHYRVLGVPLHASQAQIKAAFRELAMKLHPDKLGPRADQSSAEQFKQVVFAYEVLGSPTRRKQYDANFEFNSRSRYSSPAAGHSQTNGYAYDRSDYERKHTEFHPGGARHRRTAPGRDGFADVHIPEEFFNIKEWEAAHYGDSTSSQGAGAASSSSSSSSSTSSSSSAPGSSPRAAGAASTRSDGKTGAAWMNMGGAAQADQSFFRKKAAAAARAHDVNSGREAETKNEDEDEDTRKSSARAAASAAEHAAQQEKDRRDTSAAAENLASSRERRRQGKERAPQDPSKADCVIS
jgi:curved DNA-binding protein CbpA